MSARQAREALRVDPGAAPPTATVRQRALVVGIDRYPVRPLGNAVNDASAVAGLLTRDFAFELIGDRSLLDAEATGSRIKARVRESLAAAGGTRWLFFFAGHGLVAPSGEGFLVPVDGSPDEADTLIGMTWLVQACLRSDAVDALIVLDACYAGRALRRAEVDPWIDTEAPKSQGSVGLVAASNPFQPAADGGGAGHSVFTQCLLETLDGRLGAHLEDGAVTFLDVAVRLGPEVAARQPGGQRVLAVQIRPSAEGRHGGFRFEPRWPRLAPGRVRDLRDTDDLRGRRDALARLPEDSRDGPADLPVAARLAWNLPLALRLALVGFRDLAGPRAGTTRPPFVLGPSLELEGREARKATAAALGQLVVLARDVHVSPGASPLEAERLEEVVDAARHGVEALVQLAVRDPDPAVRLKAARWLGEALLADEQRRLGEELDRERRRSDRRGRRRLWAAACHLPRWRRGLAPPRRAWTTFGAGALLAAHGVRWVRRHRVPRGVAAVLVGLFLLTALTMTATYHVAADPRRALVVRWGLPAFAGLPGVGASAVETDWTENELPGRSLPPADVPVGLWLSTAGDLRWGRQIAARLVDDEAAIAFWRLGDGATARERLRAGAARGEPKSIAAAAYLALHEPSFVPLAIETGLAVLASQGETARRATLEALSCLPRIRPRATRLQARALSGRLADATDADLPALLDAIAAVASGAPEVTRTALARALERLSDPRAPEPSRLDAAVRRLLASRPGLAAEHHGDVLTLARHAERRDRFLAWIEALSDDASGPAGARGLLLDDLGRPGPGRAAGVALLHRLLAREPPLTETEVRQLADVVEDPDPTVLFATADLFAAQPAARRLAGRLERRLTALARDGDQPDLARAAVESLGDLGAETTLLALADNAPDEGVRSEVVSVLIELAASRDLDPTTLSTTLARAYLDPSPWVKEEAARAIVLLADRLVGRATDLYGAAFDDVLVDVERASGERLARNLGTALAGASAATQGRFCSHLARHLTSGGTVTAGDFRHYHLLRTLLDPTGGGGGELVAPLSPLLADPRSDELPWLVIDRLRALQRRRPESFTGPVEALTRDLAGIDPARRRSAARLLGPLAKEAGLAPGGVLASLTASLADTDPVVAANAAESLFWLALDRPEDADTAATRLAGALGDERLDVRRAVAASLRQVAQIEAGEVPPLHEHILSALADSDPVVRGDVARTLRSWSERAPSRLRGLLPALGRRMDLEDEPAIRARLAVTAALAVGEGPPTGRWMEVVEEAVSRETDAWWELGVLGAHRPALAPVALDLVRTHWRALEDPRVAVQVSFGIGSAHPRAGALALDVLAAMIATDPHLVARDALTNGVKPIAATWPELRPHAVAVVDDAFVALAAADDDPRSRSPGDGDHVQQAAWSLWTELSVEEAVHDRRRLWQGLASPTRGARQAALEVLSRLAADHPELRSELARGLGELRRSRRPEVRLTGAMGSEVLGLLRFVEDDSLGVDDRLRVLAALPDAGVGFLKEILRDRLATSAGNVGA